MTEYVRTWCPKCNHTVIVEETGFGQCSHCGQYLMFKRKKKQTTLDNMNVKMNLADYVQSMYHRPRDRNGHLR